MLWPLSGGAKAAGPCDFGRVANLEQQFELFDEEIVVILELEAEQRIGLAERAAADDDFGAALRDEIERREFLEDAHGVGGAEHRHSAAEADRFRPRRSGGKDHRRRRVEKFGPMMFADAEDIEAGAIGHLDLVDKISHADCGRRQSAGHRVRNIGGETVDADFHDLLLSRQLFRARGNDIDVDPDVERHIIAGRPLPLTDSETGADEIGVALGMRARAVDVERERQSQRMRGAA